MLLIHDILGWIRIRIRGSMPLTNGTGRIRILDPDPALFVSYRGTVLLRCQKNKVLLLIFYYGTTVGTVNLQPVFWIHDILEWIRIRILLFSSLTFQMLTKKQFLFKHFFCLLLFEGTFT